MLNFCHDGGATQSPSHFGVENAHNKKGISTFVCFVVLYMQIIFLFEKQFFVGVFNLFMSMGFIRLGPNC